MKFGTNYTERMRIDLSGNIGIGTTTPITSLNVSGSALLGAPPSALTTTSGVHLSTDTTINVVSTVGYPTSGILYITDSSTMQEAVTYTGTTGTSFTGVTRGRYGSTATGIPVGATVDIMLLGVSKALSTTAPAMFVTSNKGVGFGSIPPYWNGANSFYNSGQFYTSGTFVVGNTVNFGTSTVSMFGNAVSSASDYWRLSTNSLERFRADGSGNVGINNPAPRGPLEVSKQINTKLSASINSAVTTITVPANTFPASGTLIIDSEQMTYTGGGTTSFTVVRAANATVAAAHNAGATVGFYGASTFIVSSAGNVGIGTTTPVSAQVVMSGGQTTEINTITGGGYGLRTSGPIQVHDLYNYGPFRTNGDMSFMVNDWYTEAMRIKASGYVGIGTTTPQATLDVNGDIRLAKNAAEPVACSATYDGRISLTSQYTTCVCKGGTSTWVKTSDGVTACSW